MAKDVLYDYPVRQINSLVFKIADYCDQSCDYCYRGNNLIRTKNIMSDQLIFQTMHKYVEFTRNNFPDKKSVYVIWHGGEPALAGLEKFEYIVKIEKNFSEKYGIEFKNAIQSNGVHLTKAWLEFFEKEMFLVGFSLDGPKEIHDLHRKNKENSSTFEKTINTILMTLKYDINCNIISVITNESYRYCEKIYAFMRDLGVRTVDFIPCFCYDDPNTLKPEHYGEFMLGCLDLWEKDNFKPLEIRFLSDIFYKISALTQNEHIGRVSCELAGACGQNFSIGVNGEVNVCECLTPINNFIVGNIKNDTFESMLNNESYDYLISSFNDVSDECFRCEVSLVCDGGCLNRRYFLKDKLKKDIYCEPRKAIIRKAIKIYRKTLTNTSV
ncbi:MAG: radical SAM protein [Candidatus Bathyarchaeota archaeon]|nr:radical SAM protein [Candidatus Termiticorpusculum sp.]